MPTASPNAPKVRDVVGTAVLAIVCGFTRYVHINRLRNGTVPDTLKIDAFPNAQGRP